MAWVAYYLFEVTSDLPTTVTGAIRPLDHPHPDGTKNLVAAYKRREPSQTVITTVHAEWIGPTARLPSFVETPQLPFTHGDGSIANPVGTGVVTPPPTSRTVIVPGLALPDNSLVTPTALREATTLVIEGRKDCEWRLNLAFKAKGRGATVIWVRASFSIDTERNSELETAGVVLETNLDLERTKIRLALCQATGREYEATRLKLSEDIDQT